MAQKKRVQNSRYKRQKLPKTKTIRGTLILGLFVVVLVVMSVTNVISSVAIKTIQMNDKVEFYENAFNMELRDYYLKSRANLLSDGFEISRLIPVKELLTSNDELADVKANINKKLLAFKYFVKDIFIVDGNRKPLYTTLKPGEYKYVAGDIIPFKITKYDDYTLIPIEKIFKTGLNDIDKEKSYIAYFAVPQMTSKYVNKIFLQLGLFFIIVIIICMIFLSMLVRSIVKPLNTMEKTVSQIALGDLSGRLEFTKYEEINKLVGAYNLMVDALQRLYSSLKAQVNDQTKELKEAYSELKSTQAMMVHSEKMKSLGELVAGIMHEINNPINFIYGNMTHLSNYSNDLMNIIDEYTEFDKSLNENDKKKIYKVKKDCDYEFLKTDMPDLIRSCKEGAERAKNIIQDLKSFSRMEEVSIKDVYLPSEIDTVLNILHNKIKNKVTIHKEYIQDMPKIEAFGGQLNQVFMNIIDNAVGAIEKQGDIWIRINTDETKENIVIEIEDNGQGMDEETRSKVFDPFFTTKPVGQGTGLGMSITYKIIKNHQGNIKVESKKGEGSKFIITLPLNIDKEHLETSLITQEREE